MPRYLAYLQQGRRPVTTIGWCAVSLVVWLGWLRFDPSALAANVFGLLIPIRLFYVLFLLGLLAFAGLVWWTVRRGRALCACLCPYHLLLEWLGRKPTPMRVVTALMAVAASAWALSHAVGALDEGIRAGPPPAIRWIVGVGATAFAILLFGWRERVCRQACPYGIAQILMHTGTTLRVIFHARRCVNCHRCDHICPMRLKVRRECDTHLCTNCSQCIGECIDELNADWAGAALTFSAAPDVETPPDRG